ncbi:hypothetical protein BGZ73_009205 [Actinomortierella ambigua]|nr:hypothetical protein BGZ73_009205 [Actinomortierella ambigua]
MSDVYAFGMVLWQLVTDAAQPFKNISQDAVKYFVQRGVVENIPEDTNADLSALIKRCWSLQPSSRPRASSIILLLEKPSQAPAEGINDTCSEGVDDKRSDSDFSFKDEMPREMAPPEFADSPRDTAERGNADAQFKLATMIVDGMELGNSGTKAIWLYHQAATQEHTEAQAALGRVYLHGRFGVQPDRKKAIFWFRKAAHQGDSESHVEEPSLKLKKQPRGYSERLRVATRKHNSSLVGFLIKDVVSC